MFFRLLSEMSYTMIGSQTGDKPKTPTLRQYLQRTGGVCSQSTNVTTIFKPGQYGGWSLVCDGKFRVEVGEDNPIFKALQENWDSWADQSVCLVVLVHNTEKIEWSLATHDEWESDWTLKPWGAVLKLNKPRITSPDSGKATRKKSGGAGAV